MFLYHKGCRSYLVYGFVEFVIAILVMSHSLMVVSVTFLRELSFFELFFREGNVLKCGKSSYLI